MASFLELIQTIKERPAMYLSSNSISCLKAYLDGWYFRDMDGVDDVILMNAFQDWVQNKFSVKESQSYARIILFFSTDEYSALKRFFELFDSFFAGVSVIGLARYLQFSAVRQRVLGQDFFCMAASCL